jgi:hypothetical protein
VLSKPSNLARRLYTQQGKQATSATKITPAVRRIAIRWEGL